MKRLTLLMCLLLALCFTSCDSKPKETELVTIEMTLVNGEKVIETYEFEAGTKFSIETSKGSYWLAYDNGFKQVRNAVIDYKVVSRTKKQ